MTNQEIISSIYERQLGRSPDADGLQYYLGLMDKGISAADIESEINRSLEGQNFDTQYLTSQYRSLFGRNPEQEGYQYWLTQAQSNPDIYGQLLTEYLTGGAQGADINALGGNYTNIVSPSLEADPYSGRYVTESIYQVPTDAANVSYINGVPVQFAAPVTQIPYQSSLLDGSYTSNPGLAILNNPQTAASIQMALDSGAMNNEQYGVLMDELSKATTVDDVYAALNKPQANLVLDPVYGLQIGQGVTLEEAQANAPQVQQIIDSIDQGYYPSNVTISNAMQAAGIDYPFTPADYAGQGQQMTQADVLTNENAAQRAAEAAQYLYQNVGSPNFMQTNIQPGFYSERGFEPSFSPIGQGPTFRSGVAGYTQNLPTGFEFGVPPVGVSTPVFTPGTFNPNATGYDQFGQPIFGNTAQNVAQNDSYLNNPIIGYTPEGTPIYGASAPVTDSGG